MTRKKPRFFDKFHEVFGAIDNSLVNRSDVNDAIKIHQLEEKMENTFGMIDINSHLRNFPRHSNLKSNLKNSKRF